MNTNRVYVQGYESISVAGMGNDALWGALLKKRTPAGSRYPADVGLAIDGLRQKKNLKKQDLVVLAGVLAARGLFLNCDLDRGSIGVLAGSARGATETFETQHKRFLEGRPITLLTSPLTTGGVLSSVVARELGVGGIATTLSSACTTSLHGVSLGWGLVSSGLLQACVVVGSEAANTNFTREMLLRLKVHQPDVEHFSHRCFSKERSGMQLTEGAASLLLGSDANTLAGFSGPVEVLGIGSTTEQGSATGLTSTGLTKAIKSCLQHAGSTEVDLIIGHGSATKKGDAAEFEAYQKSFDFLPPVFSSKWITGHPLAASGLLGVATAMQIFKHQLVPDYPADFDLMQTHSGGKKRIKKILICALGFGGGASALLLKLH